MAHMVLGDLMFRSVWGSGRDLCCSVAQAMWFGLRGPRVWGGVPGFTGQGLGLGFMTWGSEFTARQNAY